MDHGRHTRKGACKDASSLWVLECHAAVTDKVRLLMVQTFIYSAVAGAEVWDTTKAVKDKMSAVVKLSAALHPETALLTFCRGHWATSTVYSLMLPNCVGRISNMEAGRWPKEALRFSFEGSRGVGRPKVGTDWCGNVKSITEQIQHTLNAKVTAQARVNQPCVG
jgi:hypothetical protein